MYVTVNDDAARREIRALIERNERSGVKAVADRITVAAKSETARAMSNKLDPRTNRRWEAPATATKQDPRYRELLRRTGALEGAITVSQRHVPLGAIVTLGFDGEPDVVRRAMIHTYGVKAKSRKSNRASRKRPGSVLPARRIIGLHASVVRELIEFAEKTLATT